jgi:ubiquinone/menaquinone biosynthesis C-methylase UbiE
MIVTGKNYFPELTFEIQDFFNLTYADASFAGVIGFYAIVNLRLAEVKDVLAEVLRVLQPGGIFLLSFHAAENAKELEVENFFDIDHNPLTFYYFNVDEMKTMLEKVGLQVIEVLLRYPYLQAEYPSKRAYLMLRKPPAEPPLMSLKNMGEFE